MKTNRKTVYYSKAEIKSGGIKSQHRELACEKAAEARVCAARLAVLETKLTEQEVKDDKIALEVSIEKAT